jgi:hypothetical protein
MEVEGIKARDKDKIEWVIEMGGRLETLEDAADIIRLVG